MAMPKLYCPTEHPEVGASQEISILNFLTKFVEILAAGILVLVLT